MSPCCFSAAGTRRRSPGWRARGRQASAAAAARQRDPNGAVSATAPRHSWPAAPACAADKALRASWHAPSVYRRQVERRMRRVDRQQLLEHRVIIIVEARQLVAAERVLRRIEQALV